MAEICSLCLKDVRLIKDKATGASRGFCFVELSSVEVGACIHVRETVLIVTLSTACHVV